MRTVLIQPPLDDPTMPYHAIAYLAGHLRGHGHPVTVRDLNVEFFDWSVRPEVCSRFLDDARRRLEVLGQAGPVGFAEREEAYLLARATDLDPLAPSKAVAGLRSRAGFQDLDAYDAHQETLKAHLQLMGALSYPASIRDFALRDSGRFSIFHVDDLLNKDLGDRACMLVQRFLAEQIRGDREFQEADCFGISLTYDHVLLPGIALARFLRQQFPGRLVLLGGTAISRYLKNLGTNESAARILDECDGVVMGEGETALLQIVEAKGVLSTGIPNLLTRDETSVPRWPERVHYENVRQLKRPWFGFRWDLYFSPERAICYSPSRGCYWNRCTFCDYGLNEDSPTSPWRVRDVEQVVSDLEQIQSETGFRFAYLAVDVLGGGYLDRLAEALVRRGVHLKWAAELRPEKVYTEERCRRLVDAGLVAASLGVESGNQRVLDLIDKGVTLSESAAAIRSFAAAGVAVQPMWFMGFPTETPAELGDTFDFITRHADDCSAQAFGHFTLTRGAIVAKEPSRFGITVSPIQNLEASDELAFRSVDRANRDPATAPTRLATAFPKLPAARRPWAGSVDSLHSMIMYERHGRSVFKVARNSLKAALRAPNSASAESPWRLKGRLAESSFDYGRVVEIRHLRYQHLRLMAQRSLGATWERFLAFASGFPPEPIQGATRYWLLNGERILRLDRPTYSWLQHSSSEPERWFSVPHGDSAALEHLRRVIARLRAWGFIHVEEGSEAR